MLGGPRKLDAIKLPPGFSISVFAENVTTARAMAYSPEGIVYAGSNDAGEVYAMPDKNHDGVADTVITILKGLKMPVGVAWHKGDLYISAISRILALRDIDHHLSEPPAPETVYDKLPVETHHGWKFIAFGPDGKLYIPVGAPCNICLSENPLFASIARMDPDGSGLEIVANGVRNSVGFDWDPRDSSLWFTENGRDWMGEDMPSCELNHLTSVGQHFGFPFCHQGDTLDGEFGIGKNCGDYVPPVVKLGAHMAPLGMRFYKGSMFPAKYKGAIFIAEHGSWNRSKPAGYRVSVVFPEPNGSTTEEIFAEGWLTGTSAWGRPVDVMELPDGSLLVSDDAADSIWRITYSTNSH
ncbi:MAG: sorbosone dehydrogenase family protein [Flavobacteriales bacterium]|nr:sorbosone dehydrogenase family protein [Flavobacteriales bacterium]